MVSPPPVPNMFREATKVINLLLSIALRVPIKKQPRTCSAISVPTFPTVAQDGLNMVILLKGTPETVRLKQLPKGPLTPLNFLTCIPSLGRRRWSTPFASRLPLNVTTLVPGPPLKMELIKVLTFVEGLSIPLGTTRRLPNILARVLAMVDGAQNVARIDRPRSLTNRPHLSLPPSPLWTSSRSLMAGVNNLRLDPV